MEKQNKPKISITISKNILKDIDEVSRIMDMNRSAAIQFLTECGLIYVHSFLEGGD